MSIIRTDPQNQICFWGEATFNTRPSPVTKGQRIPIIGHDLGRTQTLATSRVLRGDPNFAQPPRGRYHSDGHKISVPIEKNMIGILLYKMFNSYAVSGGADPYTHTFKVIAGAWHAAGPYFGVEIWDTEAAKGDVLDGNMIIGCDAEINTDDNEAMLTFSTSGTAKGSWEAATREQASPTTYTDVLFNMADCRVKVDTVQTTMIVNAKFSLSRKPSVRFVPDGNKWAAFNILGGVDKCDISLTALFDDAAATKALATGEAAHTVEFIFNHPTEAATHNLSFLFPEVQCYLNNVPAVGSGNEREITVEGTGYFQVGGNATCCLVTLKNPTTTYVGLMQ